MWANRVADPGHEHPGAAAIRLVAPAPAAFILPGACILQRCGLLAATG
jgi:hypothetical protein